MGNPNKRSSGMLAAPLLAAGVLLLLSAVATGGDAQTAPAANQTAQAAKGKDAPAGLAEVPPPERVARPQQIEPIVAPVKRVAPKTPILQEPETRDAKGKASAKSAKKTAVIVPARPNCDTGFKVDDSGKNCVRASSGSKAKVQKTSGKKRR